MSAGSLRRASLGPYRVVDFVGAGGMGEVYRGVHTRTGQVAAIKMLTGTVQLPALVERFRNEARIHATLVHPRIARMFEYFEVDGTPCLAMEYVDGETLDAIVQHRGPLPAPRAVALLAGVADAVGYLHQRGVVHRDLKTNNVKLSSGGEIKLLDFGIAKSHQSPRLTAVGSVVGTLHYLSPEQLRRGDAEPRSDIWALGVMLYELVTARLPFEGGGLVDVTERILRASYPAAGSIAPTVPRELDRIIARCIAQRPDDRYATCEALLTDIRALDAPAPTNTPVRVRALGAEVLGAGARGAEALGAVMRGRASGDLMRVAREKGPLIASVVAAIAGVVFVAASLRPAPGPGGVTPVAPVPPVVQPVVPEAAEPGVASDFREVRIESFGGSVTVFQGNDSVGTTPYVIRAPLGANLSFTLRRDGFEERPVQFDVNEGNNVHTYSLRARSDDRTPQPQDGSTHPMMFAGLLSFVARFRSRRRGSPGVGATSELARAGSGDGAAPELRVEAGLTSDTGCVRSINEDALRVIRPATSDDVARRGVLAVVCDGMGGHEAGEIASHLAMETIVKRFEEDDRDAATSLVKAVQAANRAVFDSAAGSPRLRGMGTTCTALVLRGGLAYCAHVGDSRLYLVRGGEIFLMTQDHSAVMELVRRGVIRFEEARHHPDRNVISRALGSHREVEISAWPQPFAVSAEDSFLLCSDGLYDLVDEADLLAAVTGHAPQVACDRLVAMARERGGPDNISVAVLSMSTADGAEPRPPRTTRAVGIPR